MGQTKNINPQNVMNGTFSYLYIDGEEVAELESVSANDEVSYEDVNQPGQLRSGQKMTGVAGSGEIVVNKITNAYYKKWSASVNAGIQPECTIVTVEADPNAMESTTIQYSGCNIGTIPYINSQPKTLTKDTIPFTFMDVKYLDPA